MNGTQTNAKINFETFCWIDLIIRQNNFYSAGKLLKLISFNSQNAYLTVITVGS